MGVDFVDGAFGAVFLELKQGFPDVGAGDGGVFKKLLLLLLTREVFLKDVKQGLEVNELGRMVHVELGQVVQNLAFHVFHQRAVLP